MANGFGATATTDEVLTGVDLSGKRVLVTGVSAGLGVETARALAAHGAQVVGAARDLAKAKRATEQVRAEAANGGNIELVELDLASLKSVRACADALVADGIPLAQFAVDDVEAEYQRLTARGVTFTQPPTDIGPAVMAVFDDTCGNLIQLMAAKQRS